MEETHDFSWALKKAKCGDFVCRNNNFWRNLRMRIGVQKPDEYSSNTGRYLYLRVDQEIPVRMPWSPTHEDLFAEDWEVWAREI